jgi:tetratricopeptide (TPR) repeat protein
MEEKLDFSLPDKKQKTSFASRLVIILLLIVIALGAANLLIEPGNQGLPAENAASSLSPEQVKQLATKLAGRNLYTRAAKLWQDYLSVGKLSDAEHAKTLFQIGTLLEKAGSFAEAIEYYYRSEAITKLDELEPQINSHVKNCFEKLGKFSALRYELMDRTSFEKSSSAGSKIVAEIGVEKITESDLDALIEAAIDNQLAPMTALMTAEQLNEQKKKMLQQYKVPAAKGQFLQSWLMQEIMYRQALEDELASEPKVKSFIDELTRSALSQQLMNQQLAGKINITETDLQTYYQANKEKFVEPTNQQDPNYVERQKSFDEVRDQVVSELVSRKSQDVQQSLIKQLMDKYNVVVHTSVLTPAGKTENDK